MVTKTIKKRYTEKLFEEPTYFYYNNKNFVDLLYAIHKEPRTKAESYDKLTHQQAGNIEVYFTDVSTSKNISDIVKQPKSTSTSKFRVLLEGAPGIGKTTVAKEIAYQWAQKKILQNIELLLLIYLRENGVQTITQFKKLVKYCYPGDKDVASDCAKYFINETQGNNLMIIFDGYDEVPKEIMENSVLMRILDKNSSGSILPECSVLITSRSHTISHLYQYCDYRVEIMGFAEEDRDNYLENALSPEKYKEALAYLDKHLIINSVCYNPLNVIIFIYLLQHKEKLPETQTELIMNSIYLTINRNRVKKDEERISSLEDPSFKQDMLLLANFAYKMIEKKQLVFTDEEINKANLKMDKDCNAFGLLQSVQFYGTVNKPQKNLFSFVHFLFQEYLAAYCLSKSNFITQSYKIYKTFWKPKYFGIWRMYTGITGGETFPLQMFLSRERIMSAGIRYIYSKTFPGISKKFETNKVMRLQLHLIMREAPNSQIATTLSSFVDDKVIDLHNENLRVQDMEILGNFIARSFISMTWNLVNLSYCNIDDENCIKFYEQLTLKDGHQKPDIATLNLSCNKICELSTVFSLAAEYKISELLVSRNSFENCRKFESDFHCSHDKLECLDMSCNELQNQHLEYVCEALSNHKNFSELIINNNKISDQGLKPLIKLLVQLEFFRTIRYENNSFSDYQYVDELLEFMIKHLNVNKTSVSFREKNQVCYFIIILGCIKDVYANRSTFVANIEQLCSLSLAIENGQLVEPNMYEKYSSLADAFCFVERMECLTELNLSYIKIDDRAGDALSKILASHMQPLEILLLNNCGITSKIAIELGKNIQVCSTIKEVQLCQNLMCDKAMISFAKLFLNLNLIIKLDDNKFSDQGKFILNILKSDVQNDTIDFSNNYYIVK